MKETDCQKALEISKKLAVDAGRKIMEIYQDEKQFNIEYKADKSPLTIADKLSNQIIVQGLRKAFPSCAVLSEEEKDDIFPEGNGWEVVSESSFEEGKKNQVNPAFAKLKILLDNQDDKNSDK